jgi:hypothetical protein
MSIKRLKHLLPAYAELEHISIDTETLDSLVEVIQSMENKFKSVYEINKELCGIHHSLASSVYDNFFQISLTDSEFNNETTVEDCEITHNELVSNGIIKSIRAKKEISAAWNSPLNELTYTKKTQVYEDNKDLFDRVITQFKSPATRIRLVKLDGNTNLAPHIDYDPSYAVRIIIPIISSPECVNLFWIKNEIKSVWLQPGKAYFLNTGFKHAVSNMGKDARYTFMISLNGTQDIENLILNA